MESAKEKAKIALETPSKLRLSRNEWIDAAENPEFEEENDMDWLEQQKYMQGVGQMAMANVANPFVPATKRQQLEQRKKELEFQLDGVNAALKAFDEHPELENFIDVIQRAGV